MANSSISKNQTLLIKSPAFSSLSEENIEWLAKRTQDFYCNIGQQLLVSDRMPDYCYFIVEGRGRVLHTDPGLRRPVTLAFSNPYDLVGWAGLARKYPCEWITAATPLQLIGFTAETFYELERRDKSFSEWLDTNNSPAELINVLEPGMRCRPFAEPQEREVMRRLLPYMKLVAARQERDLPEDENFIWLWNAQIKEKNLPIGQEVKAEVLKTIPQGEPLRLVRIVREIWERELRPSLEGIEDTSLPPQPEQDDRYKDLLVQAPAPQGERFDEINIPNLEKDSAPILWKGNRIPVSSGIGSLGQTMACLEMLSLFYNVPFRKDVLERAAKETLRNRKVSLETLGNLSTLMGFFGTISDLPSAQLSRVSFPCFAICEDQLAMIHDISNGEVKAVLPEYGRVTFSLDELLKGEAGARILCLTPSRDVHQRKLNFKWFFPQLRKYRRSLIEVFFAALMLKLLGLAQPLVMQQIFDKVIVQQNLDTLYTLGIVLLGVALFQGLIGAVQTYLFADTTNRIDIALGAQVIQHLLRLPQRYFDNRPVGELQTRLAELGNIRNFLTGSLLTLVLDAVFSVIYIGVMFVYSGVLTAVTLGVIPLFLGLVVVVSPIIRGQLRKAAEANARTQSLLVESLNGVQTIKAQNAENNVRWQWQRRYSNFMSENFRTLMIGVSAGTVGAFLNQLTGLLTLWVGAYLVIKGQLTIGQLIAFRIISGYVVGPLLNLATSWQSFQSVALSMERLSDVVDATAEGSTEDLDQLPLPPIAGEVEFQDVDFRFNDGSPLVVNRVGFEISAGAFVGIVGRSGSGKSTIMKLVPRLYEPSSGRILIDGYDIGKLQLGSVRRQIGIVPQDSLLFEGTIRDNISLTCPDASTEEIVHAARVACAHDFIMELTDGYVTRVGERGSGLSGGQRQRIAIARAVLQRPSLLILDEATSALDYLTERQVCINLKKEFSGSTVFFITHRLSTIRAADQILMLDQGSLIEKGTHKELLELKGRYYALYSQQETDLD